MADFLTDVTSAVLAKGLDAAISRNRAIADNVANVDTPGYKRKQVLFSQDLQEALSASDASAAISRVQQLSPEAVEDTTSPANANGNNVRIDQEMADLSKNGLDFATFVRLLNTKNGMMMTAITEGKR